VFRVIAMMNFIKSAFFKAFEDRSLGIALRPGAQRLDLFLIVLVDKCLYGFDSCKNRLPSEQGRKETGQKACHSPQWQHKTRSVAALQPVKKAKVFAFSGQMILGKSQEFAFRACGKNAPVNPDRASLAGMAAPQLLLKLLTHPRCQQLIQVFWVDLQIRHFRCS
jgi:hypothetical protein